jgi:hypothetical protein
MLGEGETTGGHRDASSSTKQGSTRALVALLAFVLGFATVPHRVMEREASKWFRGDPAKTDALAASVARWTSARNDITPPSFASGASRFDGEWLFSMYMMAAMGFGQLALERADARDENLARMETCLDAMLERRVRIFESSAWATDALDSVSAVPGSSADRGHIAYLGNTGLALALHRILKPASKFIETEDALARTIARRIEASPTGLVETYPGTIYPVDNASALAALALHGRATNRAPAPAFARGLDALKRHGVDPATGLFFHTLNADDAKPRVGARASGTALGAYFLSFADASMSRAVFVALERSQFRTVLGFGGMMEYPPGKKGTPAFLDSGPLLLGFGVAASGYALGAGRAHGHRDLFTSLYATAHLFGVPLDEDGVRTYVAGGPLGDAILFAMLTTPPIGMLKGP